MVVPDLNIIASFCFKLSFNLFALFCSPNFTLTQLGLRNFLSEESCYPKVSNRSWWVFL